MAMYTARSIAHSLQSVIASTEAALGELYSSASSPNPLRSHSSITACLCHRQGEAHLSRCRKRCL